MTQAVTVTAPNVAPSAGFTHTTVDLVASFTDTSSDGDGVIATWLWDFGDGAGTSTQASPSYTYGSAGTYDVTLTVTDDDGATDAVTQAVTVTAPNVAPSADFQIVCRRGNECLFRDRSVDDGLIQAWLWSIRRDSDGSIVPLQGPNTGPELEHLFAEAGVFQVTLEVTDDQSASAQVTKPVVCESRGNAVRCSG